MQTRRRPAHPPTPRPASSPSAPTRWGHPAPATPRHRTARAASVALSALIGLTALLWCALAAADDPKDPKDASQGPINAAAQAREDYLRCLDLKALGRYCKALEACEEGLDHHPANAALKGLADDLRKRCEAEERRPTCGFGLVATARTGWNCCWPGQTWDGTQCQGVPTRCEEHFDLDEPGQRCVPKRCEEGQYHVDGVHCCWPGQRWSRSRELCIYQPRCPEGFEPHNGSCRLAAGCTPGQVRIDKIHCCWPGQRWSANARACTGPPKCPPNTTPNDANGCSPSP